MTECRYVCRRELFNAVNSEESCREAITDFAGLFAKNGDSIENFEGMLVLAKQDTSYSGLFKHEDLTKLEKRQIGCNEFKKKYFPESRVCLTCGLCPEYANRNNDIEKGALIYLSTLNAKERDMFFPSDEQTLIQIADKFAAYDDIYHIKRTNGKRYFIRLNRQIFRVFASIHRKGLLADGKLAAVKAGDFYREWDSLNPDALSSVRQDATDEEKETAASVRSYLATRLKYIVAESRKPMSSENVNKVRELMNPQEEASKKPQINLTNLVNYISNSQTEAGSKSQVGSRSIAETPARRDLRNTSKAPNVHTDNSARDKKPKAEHAKNKTTSKPVQDHVEKAEPQAQSVEINEQQIKPKTEFKTEIINESKAAPANNKGKVALENPTAIDYSLFAIPVVSRQEYEQYALAGCKERTERFISMLSEKTLKGVAVLLEPLRVEESEIYGFLLRFADVEDYFIAEKDDASVMFAVKKLIQSRTDVKITDKAIPLYYMAYLCNILCPECIVPRMTAEESFKTERNAIARMNDYLKEVELIRTRSYIQDIQNIEKGIAHSLYSTKPGETCMFTYMPEYRFVFKKNDIKPTEDTEIINVIVGQDMLPTAQFSESITKLIGQFEANNVFRKKTVRLVQIAFGAGSFALEVKKDEYRGVCSLVSRHYMKVLHQLTKQPVFKLIRGQT